MSTRKVANIPEGCPSCRGESRPRLRGATALDLATLRRPPHLPPPPGAGGASGPSAGGMRALRAWGSRPSRRRWGPQRHRRPRRRRGAGAAALAARVPAIPARAGAPAALATWSRPPVRAWLLRPPQSGRRGQARRLRPPRRGRGARELQSRQSGKPPHTRRGVRMPRPEFQAPPDVFYNESEVPKYTTSSRIIEIQVSKRSASPRLI